MIKIIDYAKNNPVATTSGVFLLGLLVGAYFAFFLQPKTKTALFLQPAGALCLYGPSNAKYCIKPSIQPGNKCLNIPGLRKIGEC